MIEITYLKNTCLKETISGFKLLSHHIIFKVFLNPFTRSNHYRFGTKLSQEIKSKISSTLKGRLVSETRKVNHILGANKKRVFCFDWKSGNYLMELLDGIRIMMRALNIKYIEAIRSKIDKNKPLEVTINGETKKLLVKSSKI